MNQSIVISVVKHVLAVNGLRRVGEDAMKLSTFK
jgi:hypothetical protein